MNKYVLFNANINIFSHFNFQILSDIDDAIDDIFKQETEFFLPEIIDQRYLLAKLRLKTQKEGKSRLMSRLIRL